LAGGLSWQSPPVAHWRIGWSAAVMLEIERIALVKFAFARGAFRKHGFSASRARPAESRPDPVPGRAEGRSELPVDGHGAGLQDARSAVAPNLSSFPLSCPWLPEKGSLEGGNREP